MRFTPFLLVASFALTTTPGCSQDEELLNTAGTGDTGGDGITLEANPPDTTVPDMPDTMVPDMPDTTATPDSGADSTMPDTKVPDVFVLPDTVGLDLATLDTAPLDSFVGPTCATATECPGKDLECAKRACIGGRCTVSFVAIGTPTVMQVPFNCKRSECDGAGLVQDVYDPTDLPNDNNECTLDSCPTATPVNTPLPAGSLCTKGGRMCDGAGRCVACLSASDCGATSLSCSSATCVGGVCGTASSPSGTKTGPQIIGDCQSVVCDGSGGTKTIYDSTDPKKDAYECTFDTCNPAAGPTSAPYTRHTPVADGTPCNSGANTCRTVFVDGPPISVCGQCDLPSDCYYTADTSYTDCQQPTCVNHRCGKEPKNEAGVCYEYVPLYSRYCPGTCATGVCTRVSCPL